MSSHSPPRELAAYLHYGYVLDENRDPATLPFERETLEQAAAQRTEMARLSESELCAYGAKLWRSVCRRTLERNPGNLLLPLSSGLDSRAILAGLLEEGHDQLATVTYGIPGAYDFDLAPLVAHTAGVPNERIDLRDIGIHRSDLLGIAAEPGRSSALFDMFFNRIVTRRHENSWTCLSGYLGDVLAGKNDQRTQSAYWDEARTAFARRNRRTKNMPLAPSGTDPVASLPEAPIVSAQLLSYEAQLDFAVRQERMMRPIVIGADTTHAKPFLDPQWVAFMLSLPEEQRRDRQLFKRVFLKAYPRLFSLPTTANGGMPLGAPAWRQRLHRHAVRRRRKWRSRLHRFFPSVAVPPGAPQWQYVDFARELRTDSDIQRLVSDSIERLGEHGHVPWLEPDAIWRAHQQRQGDYSKELDVLLNVELMLSAQSAEPSLETDL